jgi:LysR family hydrogen peroxide-inducible transcriptional activator
LKAGILDNTNITARPLDEINAVRKIALVWRRASPREKDFELLAKALADIQ